MIISVHTPKCNGTSFRAILEEHYQSKFILDSNDKPIHKPFSTTTTEAELFKSNFKDVNYETCIHGHFLPYKYSSLIKNDKVTFVTWLRDPLERIASHYYFWKRYENTKDIAQFGDLRKKVLLEKWSLEKFCFSDELQNLYCTFFWKFPLVNFEFIGITEFFNSEIEYFSLKYLGKPITEIPRLNINPDKTKPYFQDSMLIEELKSFHSKDYELYNQALRIRKDRIKNQENHILFRPI